MNGLWRRRAGFVGILYVLALATPPAVFGARAWTLERSPGTLQLGVSTSVTLSVQNTGGDGGGDEITCVVLDVPGSFAVSSFAVVSVKGVTSTATHGWSAYASASGDTTRVAFKNPSDDNPLVGLPAGDSAVFRVVGTGSAPGTMSWGATAFDKPDKAGTTKCGSGAFPAMTLSFTVAGAVTPPPTPAPTLPPTPRPTPSATPIPTARPTLTATPTPTQRATPRPAPTATPRSTFAPQPAVSSAPAPVASLTSPPSTPEPTGTPPTVPSTAPAWTPSNPRSPSPSPTVVPTSSADASSQPATSGEPGPGGPITIGPTDRGNRSGQAIDGLGGAVASAFVQLGLVGWSVPAIALGVPGLLVLLVVALQLVGGAAWLPIARRWLSRAAAPKRTPSPDLSTRLGP